ncbi:protein AIG1 [Biomphalaria pfeifferi]|uniref:Protein AIG1 n=1 Tax=Biomphalaria pfeifferi TaxID=112525 RepID=A0AAD8B8G3_BIOPF|nr:protein AIG1 [Biomphalaria pfeifferi]
MATMKRLLLVGRGGNGLTSCAKSIKEAQTDYTPFKTLAIECPGVGDTGDGRRESIESTRYTLKEILKEYNKDGGFNAIALVLKYGARFTKQEKDAVEEVKLMFGKNVFQKHGIIIMSYGDLFGLIKETDGPTFMDWVTEQRGDVEKLFKEVKRKVYLLDNKTKDMEIKRCQYNDLIECFRYLSEPYTLQDFENARRENLSADTSYNDSNLPQEGGSRYQLTNFVKDHPKNVLVLILFLVFAVIVFFILSISKTCK